MRLDEQRITALLRGSLGTSLEEPKLGYVYVADDGTTPAETSHGTGWCSVRINDNAEYTAVKIAPGMRAVLRDGLAVRLERDRDGTLYITAIDRVEGFEQLSGADPEQTIGVHDHQDTLNGGTLDAAAIASGQLLLERGGTEADLSATGGANHFLQQLSAGAAITVNAIDATDIPYTVTTSADWPGTDPTDVGEGLDTLADRVTVIEGGGIGGGGIVSAPPSVCEGRLTLESGVALSTSDQTAKTSLYFTPYNGNKVGLYDGADWAIYNFTERTLSLSGYTADKNYDIWLYNNSGTLTLDSTVWTNDTTRATALTTQDGVLVKSGDTTRRYIGTIRITGTTGQCEDSVSKRYVWNNVNRKRRNLRVTESTDTWSGSGGAAWRYANNSDVNRVFYVAGMSEDLAEAVCHFSGGGTGTASSMGIGVDTGTANSAQLVAEIGGSQNVSAASFYRGYPGIGYHYLSWIEYARTGTPTFRGDAGTATITCGLMAEVWG